MKTPTIVKAEIIGKEGKLAVLKNEYEDFSLLPEKLIRGCTNINTKLFVMTTEVVETKGVCVDFLEINFN